MPQLRTLRWRYDVVVYLARGLADLGRRSTVPLRLRGTLHAARAAEAAWRLDDALAAWGTLRSRAPRFAYGHLHYAGVLAKLGREPDGIAALDEAAALFPQSPAVALSRARLTVQMGDFARALALSHDIVARFPRRPLGYELMAKALRGLSRFDAADEVLAAARQRFPADLGLAVEAALTADVRGDWAAMLARSAPMLQQFPNAPLAHACVGGALRKLNRFDEADAVLAAAMRRFPADSNLAMNHAWVADHRGDWDASLRRWGAVNARFGREPRVRAAYLESTGRADLARSADAANGDAAAAALPPDSRMDTPPPGATPHAALLNRFQSLGGTCEFGFVQRHFGAEPLGLLRWAGISYPKLLAGLADAFEGVGGAERTRLGVNASNQEYYTSDTLYGLGMHTFVLASAIAEAEFLARMRRRLAFLRERLLDDLGSGDKIFVFHTAEPVGDEEARALFNAIRRHGPGRLLFVRLAQPEERPGKVFALEPGLTIGLLDRTGLREGHWNVSFDCWLTLCRAADALLCANDA